ncbi:MAG: hypothetical protein OQL06_08350 [Gammaproteobacteria bacterium]|nr:hypothetical protein [Gammaproteobacteria bacterium]
MIKEILKATVTVLVCNGLIYTPLLRAAQLSLPSGDLIAPEITQEKYVDTVRSGDNHEIKIKVTDNVGVKQVTLYYRIIGSTDYKRRLMQRVNTSDNYVANINADEIKAPGIEYYIQAMDLAGNTLLHGYSFSPLSVKLGAPARVATTKPPESEPMVKPEDEDDSNKWLWIGLGILAVGAAAGGGGGGGGGTDTATLTVTVTEP